jgi:ribosome biogenesis GTPase A
LNINWYPGHMAKTKRQIQEDLKLIDVVVELLDSRIPISSRNPDINTIVKGKKKIIVLNKSDLADEKETIKWVEYFKAQKIPAVITDANSGKGIKEVIKQAELIMKDELDKREEKGRTGRKIRIMILGIPNVGKSSFINRLANKNSLEVGNKPGVTRKKQWIKISNSIELLDTPGVLWPKFESDEVALNLAYTGTIKDDVLEKTDVAFYFLKYMLENEIDKLVARYNLSKQELLNSLENQTRPENEIIYDIMLQIGKLRGAVVSGGNVDDVKTANIILEDFRSGKLGRITLEKVQAK